MAKSRKNAGKRMRRRGRLTLAAGAMLLCGLIFWVTTWGDDSEPPSQPEPTLAANVYSESDFEKQDGRIICTTGDFLQGIDVSSHQEQINWEQVRADGIDFAMIRVGYRGYDLGEIHADSFGEENYAEAGRAGLLRGVYFYSQAVTPEEAREEADFVLSFLQDRQPELPVVFDWEYVSHDARTGKLSRQEMTDCALAFCQRIAEAGLAPMVYFNQDLAGTRLELTSVQSYGFWLAQYTDALTFPAAVSMWQYTDAGSVAGITGDVDMDLLFLAEDSADSTAFQG